MTSNENFYNSDFLDYCDKIMKILASYYQFSSIPNIKNYLMTPAEESMPSGQILFEEGEDDFFIGIQFAKEIHRKVLENEMLSAHEVSVLAEELSHFKFISDVVEKETQTNLLTVETLGEIDRFLCVMHWNHMGASTKKIDRNWKNIHQICDLVFTGDRFYHGNKKLYIEAENLAFRHLKEAFAEQWDCTYFNFSTVSNSAKNYLFQLRGKFLA